jgi:hypothetical protein
VLPEALLAQDRNSKRAEAQRAADLPIAEQMEGLLRGHLDLDVT